MARRISKDASPIHLKNLPTQTTKIMTKSQDLILEDLVKVILIARKRVYWSIARAKHPFNSLIVDLIPSCAVKCERKIHQKLLQILLPLWVAADLIY